MIQKKSFKKTILVAAALSAAITLNGCTTINSYTGQEEVSDATIGAGIGTVGGALIGGLAGGGKGALIGAAAGGLAGGFIGHSLDNANEELRQRLVGTGVQVTRNGNSIQLSMASDVTFKIDSADINSSFYKTLDSVSIVLKKYNKANVSIAGYTYNTGSDMHNQILSEQRAKSVGSYLISRNISAGRIFTQGFGKRYPVTNNDNAYGRAQNRRVVITLR